MTLKNIITNDIKEKNNDNNNNDINNACSTD